MRTPESSLGSREAMLSLHHARRLPELCPHHPGLDWHHTCSRTWLSTLELRLLHQIRRDDSGPLFLSGEILAGVLPASLSVGAPPFPRRREGTGSSFGGTALTHSAGWCHPCHRACPHIRLPAPSSKNKSPSGPHFGPILLSAAHDQCAHIGCVCACSACA